MNCRDHADTGEPKRSSSEVSIDCSDELKGGANASEHPDTAASEGHTAAHETAMAPEAIMTQKKKRRKLSKHAQGTSCTFLAPFHAC